VISHAVSPSYTLWRRLRRRPRIIAVFSFRYDAHLVPDLLANITPFVDGWISWDDRQSTDYFSNEGVRQAELIRAASLHGAGWILAIDPDERLESGKVKAFRKLTRTHEPVAWSFRLRELYTPDTYRVDGIWGKKRQARLFPAFDPPKVDDYTLHRSWFPKDRFDTRPCGINLYHLKMISPNRRAARRDLYRHLDPGQSFQGRGYDYLADETGATYEKIPSHRTYYPPHADDGDLWMPAVPQDMK